ncbi:MAG: hypothetical protein GAK45_00131 [Pseudomonas citronellolis]|nr:MAG: hypothetical protein GAK45_00131 [Pseudomonas citronellolis]
MAVTYYALLTTIGAAKLANAAALGTTLKITQLAVGDGGGNVPTPDASRTALVNEVRRAPLNTLSIDAANSSQIIAEQVIPEDVGGWWIREMGLFDDVGALIAYANCAPSYKPQLAEGSGRTQTVRMVLIVTSTGAVELKIDPSVVLATRSYVDTSIADALGKLDFKQSARYATTANVALSGLVTQVGGDWPAALTAGDRVLVKNQTTASQNGLYVVAAGAWARAADADSNAEVTPGMVVVVEAGTLLADTIWQLITDAPIVVGTTALTFQDITNGLARLQSPAFVGNPTAPSPARFDSSTQIPNTNWVKRRGAERAGILDFNNASGTLTADQSGWIVSVRGIGAQTITLPAASAVPVGGLFEFISTTAITSTNTITRAGTDTISGLLNGATMTGATSFSIRGGDSIVLVSDGSAIWYAVSNSSQNFVQQQLAQAIGTTGAKCTNTLMPATTAYALANRGMVNGGVSGIGISVNTTLVAATAIGAWHEIQGSGLTVTLPAVATCYTGSTISFKAAYDFTIAANGSETISVPSGSAANTKTFFAGETITIVSNATSWSVISDGFGADSFAHLLASNGYQKLPGGVIIQWGSVTNSATAGSATAVTFPIAFPNAARSVHLNSTVASTTPAYAWCDGVTASGFNSRSNTANSGAYYIAIGY